LKVVFETPILFLIFNRPETTQQVFNEIKKQRPRFLYVAADGPRLEKEGEAEKCKLTRDIIRQIDWDCQLVTLFREVNLGCGRAVSEAITWFFDNVEMGIILEDDCLPSESFFIFMDKMLKKYQNDTRVMQINGSSFIKNDETTDSYYFSKYNHIWGWATWRRAWSRYEITNPNFVKDFKRFRNFNSNSERRYWFSIFKNYYNGGIDTWDYPWTFTVWKHDGLAIYPFYNLVKNIGFGPQATHTTQIDNKLANLELDELSVIFDPKRVMINHKLDLINFNTVFRPPSFSQKIINKLRRILSR